MVGVKKSLRTTTTTTDWQNQKFPGITVELTYIGHDISTKCRCVLWWELKNNNAVISMYGVRRRPLVYFPECINMQSSHIYIKHYCIFKINLCNYLDLEKLFATEKHTYKNVKRLFYKLGKSYLYHCLCLCETKNYI